jgi:GalNAc-alpha-(1->4)-GalNAc-alpha-(1->3)-diNAcBac-PP-undecaprenol alpha-1,4-N-acetyl-D-galactosaminyltransferase
MGKIAYPVCWNQLPTVRYKGRAMLHMKKVTLAIGGMGSGGAERVMSILANYWASHDWEVTLLTLIDRSKPPFYELDPRIKLIQLGVAGGSANALTALLNVWRRVKVLRSAIIASEPDVVISFMGTASVLTLLACWNANFPVIVCKHIYPGLSELNQVWQLLIKLTYRHADLVTVLTQNALPFFPAEKGYRTTVMPNPVLIPVAEIVTERLLPTPTLIAVGRLTPQKGFDLLILAFAKLRDKYPDWHLTILGEGSIRSELEVLRTQLDLGDVVHLPGQVQNVNAYLRQADIFVMSSRFEGFPMALCEAMACGLPVISADCLSGPREIITDGVDGILVATEDVEALVVGLDRLMSNPIERAKLAQAAPAVLDRFGLEQVMKMWSDEIEAAIVRRKGFR